MQRQILHIDMNSYFATCEQQANPFLRGKPIAVGGDPRSYYSGQISRSRTLIVAASREAKKRGVKSVMPSWEAIKICPELIFVPGDHVKYRWVTEKFLEIFKSYSSILEIFSIDEVFLDVSETAERFGGAINIAKEIKTRLKNEVGEWMTCSIGVAENKLMAKLGSDMKKPDGLTVINKDNLDKILGSIKLTDFCGIGERIEARLNRMGIFTVKQMRDCSYEKLIKEFKSYGHKLYLMARGEDHSELIPYYALPNEKSMGHSYTLPKDIWQIDQIRAVILQMSEKVGRRLRKKGFVARCVTLYLRYSFYKSNESDGSSRPGFRHFHKQKKVSYWFSDGYDIYKIANNILDEWKDRESVRMVGVTVTCLEKIEQISCLDRDNKFMKILLASDKINNKFGENTIFRGGYLDADKAHLAMPKKLKSPVSFLRRVDD